MANTTALSTALSIAPSEYRLIGNIGEQLDAVLNSNLPPGNKREALEQIAHDCLVVSGNFVGRFWLILYIIRKEGLWRTARNHENLPYPDYTSYQRDLIAQMGGVSERTAWAMMAKLDALDTLGVDAQSAVGLIAGMPTITERALAVGEFDPATGAFIRIADNKTRERIKDALGIVDDEGSPADDKELLREFLTKLPELDQRDASALVARVTGAVRRRLYYDPKNLEVVFCVSGDGVAAEARFVLKDKSKPLPPPIRQWLMSIVLR
jgi:hypothetical protein